MSRLQSVDVFRVVAILAVIGLHGAQQTHPGTLGRQFDAATFADQAERFAVPMFFALSGYFWAAKCGAPCDCWPRAQALGRRVLVLFACWCLVYLAWEVVCDLRRLPLALAIEATAGRHRSVLTLLFAGTRVHLWFLPALAVAALVSGACLATGRWRLLVLLAAACFLAGLAGKAYAPALGFVPHFNFRDGPFFSLPLFVAGVALRRREPGPAWFVRGLLLAIAGLTLQLAEVNWLHERWGAGMVQDYVFGTFFYGLGVTMMALSGVRALHVAPLAAAGPLVLGIYASHYLFIELLHPLNDRLQAYPGWSVAYIVLVFAGALGLTALLARFAPTRRLVM
jgi:surface polysaccharide O-acyltransferase-like enzyme